MPLAYARGAEAPGYSFGGFHPLGSRGSNGLAVGENQPIALSSSKEGNPATNANAYALHVPAGICRIIQRFPSK